MLNHLPPPSPEAIVHSETLTAYIIEQIQQHGGRIRFEQFMQHALYAPELGYYSAGAPKFGESGDFITAPEISPYFAQCLANQAAQVLTLIPNADILEFGAGTGIMAADILLTLDTRHQLPPTYYILEPSPDLQQRQQETLTNKAPHLLSKVQWLTALPTVFNGIILANEVLDAMPVHRVRLDHQQNQEFYVSHQSHQFNWELGPPSTPQLNHAMEAIRPYLDNPLSQPYQTEINLNAQYWIHTLADILQSGLILIIDYGYPASEYYHPTRQQGSLMCYYQHRAHSDPFHFPGLQDITAHVDFSAIAQTAIQAGLQLNGYTSQGNFLISAGITQSLEPLDPTDTVTFYSATQQIKKLTMPNAMGELFKVLALSKNLDISLSGFSIRNQIQHL